MVKFISVGTFIIEGNWLTEIEGERNMFNKNSNLLKRYGRLKISHFFTPSV